MTKFFKLGVTILLIICVGIYIFVVYTPSVNSNNERVAFVTYSAIPRLSAFLLRDEIYVMNVDSSGLTSVVQEPSIDFGLDWSPQGDKIAYYSYDTRGLYIAHADGSGESELLEREIFVVYLSWSPDGTRITYSDGTGSIYIFNLTTKQTTRLLTEDIEGSQPDWSPDGTRIVFRLNPSSRGPNSSIAIINSDSTNLIQLTPDDNSRSPKWSPDGNKILFERNRNLYIMNIDGTNVRALIDDGKSYMPDWSPNGQRIVFVSDANERCSDLGRLIGIETDVSGFCTNELWVINADGSNMRVIKEGKGQRFVSPVWAPTNN